MRGSHREHDRHCQQDPPLGPVPVFVPFVPFVSFVFAKRLHADHVPRTIPDVRRRPSIPGTLRAFLYSSGTRRAVSARGCRTNQPDTSCRRLTTGRQPTSASSSGESPSSCRGDLSSSRTTITRAARHQVHARPGRRVQGVKGTLTLRARCRCCRRRSPRAAARRAQSAAKMPRAGGAGEPQSDMRGGSVRWPGRALLGIAAGTRRRERPGPTRWRSARAGSLLGPPQGDDRPSRCRVCHERPPTADPRPLCAEVQCPRSTHRLCSWRRVSGRRQRRPEPRPLLERRLCDGCGQLPPQPARGLSRAD